MFQALSCPPQLSLLQHLSPIITSLRKLVLHSLPGKHMAPCKRAASAAREESRSQATRDDKAFLLQWGLGAAHPSFSVLTLETTKPPQEGAHPGQPTRTGLELPQPGAEHQTSPVRSSPVAVQAEIRNLPIPLSASTPFGAGLCWGQSLAQDQLVQKTQISDLRHHL